MVGVDPSPSRLIAAAREGSGRSQRSLAEMCGTSQPAIARYESGRALPSIATLDRILAVCGLELEVRLRPLHSQAASRVDGLLAMSPTERLEREAAQVDVVTIAAALVRTGASFVVVGEVAALAHGLPVAPTQLEIAIDTTGEGPDRVAAALRQLGAQRWDSERQWWAGRPTAESVGSADGAVFSMLGGKVLVRANGFAKAAAGAVVMNVGGCDVRFAGISQLGAELETARDAAAVVLARWQAKGHDYAE